ncbi:MAG: RnfABCDGE type electron transport complex subunit B [Desulfosarcina sp.]|nr:RnfABCDGE type electron transport complex subunit B [Desulfobacterales bacterium]
MNFVTVGLSAGTLLAMAVVLTYILGWASRKFYVEVDPRVEAIMEARPGANCGGCGFVGCSDYAEAIVGSGAAVNKCTVGGESCAADVAGIMGVELTDTRPYRPIVHCGAHTEDKLQRHKYRGEKTCAAVNIVSGVQGCIYGCLGYGDCTRVCNYDAIQVQDGLATVDYDKCVGCGACADACPRNIITITPFKFERVLAVACSNKDFGKAVKDVCKVGCIGCKACAKTCSLFTIQDNLSTINYDAYCQDYSEELHKAFEKCPQKRLMLVGKPSAKHLEETKDMVMPELVEADFRTTADDMEWWG